MNAVGTKTRQLSRILGHSQLLLLRLLMKLNVKGKTKELVLSLATVEWPFRNTSCLNGRSKRLFVWTDIEAPL